MITSKITAKGQTLIPKKVRDFLHVDISDTICFTLLEDGKVLLTSETRSAQQLFGLFKDKKRSQPVSIEEMEAIIEARHKKKVHFWQIGYQNQAQYKLMKGQYGGTI